MATELDIYLCDLREYLVIENATIPCMFLLGIPTLSGLLAVSRTPCPLDGFRLPILVTDEPTTGNYPPERAIEVCQSLGVKAYVIGVISSGNMFQSTLAEQTHGLFFPMPKGFSKTYPYQ